MFRTRITELFKIERPIIGGTMMWISTPELVAAVSDAGGLGILCSAMYQSKEEFRKAILRVRDLTSKPFGVNVNMFPMVRPLDNEAIIEAILDEGVGIVETSGHKAPEEYVDRLKRHGIRMIHKCVGVRYAQKAEALGVDAVTVVGYENGGATGRLDIATMVLVPAVVDAVKIPVIGGGGVADGRGFLAVLSLGAEGVILGTRLLVTRECPIHPLLKKALVSASEQDTMLVMRSIQATHRVWINEAARKTARMEAEGADLPALLTVIGGENTRRMIDGGDLDAGIISCGQAIGLVREELGIQDLMDRIITQAEAIHVRLAPAA